MESKLVDALLVELKKVQQRRVKTVLTWETLEDWLRNALDPKQEEPLGDDPLPKLPTIPEQYPRLLASYGKTLEYIVVNNDAQWAPYHDWYTVFPPAQAACRPITATIESEVERLKGEGFTERPREDWQRRKQQAAAR